MAISATVEIRLDWGDRKVGLPFLSVVGVLTALANTSWGTMEIIGCRPGLTLARSLRGLEILIQNVGLARKIRSPMVFRMRATLGGL
ncbi:hypothetical protein [Cupriavidus sp. 8B]